MPEEIPRKKREVFEVPKEEGPQKDPLMDYGWKKKKRTNEQAFVGN